MCNIAIQYFYRLFSPNIFFKKKINIQKQNLTLLISQQVNIMWNMKMKKSTFLGTKNTYYLHMKLLILLVVRAQLVKH